MQGAWRSDSRPCSPVLGPGVQGSVQVNTPRPLQECSQILAPLGPQSSQLPNGYNHPHPTQLIKANRVKALGNERLRDLIIQMKIVIGPRSGIRNNRRGSTRSALCSAPLEGEKQELGWKNSTYREEGAPALLRIGHLPRDSVSSPVQRGSTIPARLPPRASMRLVREQAWKSFAHCEAQCTHAG